MPSDGACMFLSRGLHESSSITRFADDTTVVGLISNSNETTYREDVQHLVAWHTDNNLLLNTCKTKEITVDFRSKRAGMHDPIYIHSVAVEHVSNFNFLGIHISENLSWTTNTSSLVKKAHQRIFFLRTLKKHHLSMAVLVNFHCSVIESILNGIITVWYGKCTVMDCKALQRVVKTAQCIMGSPLQLISGLTTFSKTSFTLPINSARLSSGRCFRNLWTKTSRQEQPFLQNCVLIELGQLLALSISPLDFKWYYSIPIIHTTTVYIMFINYILHNSR